MFILGDSVLGSNTLEEKGAKANTIRITTDKGSIKKIRYSDENPPNFKDLIYKKPKDTEV